MSLLSRLFGSGSSEPEKPEEYNGYAITPAPISEGGRWRLGARIEKVVDGETKVHQLIRADVFESEEVARTESLAKARMSIDQLGDRLFD